MKCLSFFLCILLLSLFISCGSDSAKKDGDAVSQGAESVKISVRSDAPKDQCPNGGVKIDMGFDKNENGKLDSDEITETKYVCHGKDGKDGEPGNNGKDGDKGEAGENGDDGAKGDQGEAGKNALTKVSDEPQDTENCDGHGGKKIETGIDDNGNGILDEDEVDSVEYICNNGLDDVWFGEYYLSTTEDLEELRKYRIVTGEIYIRTGELEEISGLEKLQRIGGLYLDYSQSVKKIELSGLKMIIGQEGINVYESNSLVEISMPELEKITVSDDAINLNNNMSLTTISMPKLTQVTGYDGIEIRESEKIENISFPLLKKLRSRDDGLVFENNQALKQISFPLLESLEGADRVLNIYNNPELTTVSFPVLTEIKVVEDQNGPYGPTMRRPSDIALMISNNGKIATTEFNLLEAVEGPVMITGAGALTSLDGFQALKSVAGSFEIMSNPELADITAIYDMDFIENEINIVSNGKLPQCQAEEFVKRMRYLKFWEGASQVRDNLETGVCENSIVCTKDVAVTDEASLDELNGCVILDGNLNADEATIASINIENLKAVTGKIDITGNDVVTTLAFPDLIFIGGMEIMSNDLLTGINFPLLERVGEFGIAFGGCPETTDLSFPKLKRIKSLSDSIYLGSNLKLATLSFPVLEAIFSDGEAMLFEENDSLASINFPQLSTVTSRHGISMSYIGEITSITFPKLQKIAKNTGTSFYIGNCDKLTQVQLPLLETVSGSISAQSNPKLTTIAIPEAVTIGKDLRLIDNVLFSALSSPKLISIEGNFVIDNNDAVMTFHFLTELEKVGGVITVQNNNNLTDITGLHSVTNVGTSNQGTVTFKNNSYLSSQLVVQFSEELISHGWTGTLVNEGNLN